MTEPEFPLQAKILASSSELFPVDSVLHFERPSAARVKLVLKKEGHPPKDLFESDLVKPPPDEARSIKGPLSDRHRLVVTICTGKKPDLLPRYIVGQVLEVKPGIEGGGTGVWVSEEPPKAPPKE